MAKQPIDIEELLALIGEREVEIHLLKKQIAQLQQALAAASAVSKDRANTE